MRKRLKSRKLSFATGCVLMLTAAPSSVWANSDGGEISPSSEPLPSPAYSWRFGLRAVLSTWTDASLEYKVPLRHRDLASTAGVELTVEIPVGRYIVLGAIVRPPGAELGEAGDSAMWNSSFWDAAFLPKLRYPFPNGLDLGELYVGVPVGIGQSKLDERLVEEVRDEVHGPSYLIFESEQTPCFTFGVLGGFAYYLSKHLGLNFDVAYRYSTFEHSSYLRISRRDVRFAVGAVVAL